VRLNPMAVCHGCYALHNEKQRTRTAAIAVRLIPMAVCHGCYALHNEKQGTETAAIAVRLIPTAVCHGCYALRNEEQGGPHHRLFHFEYGRCLPHERDLPYEGGFVADRFTAGPLKLVVDQLHVAADAITN